MDAQIDQLCRRASIKKLALFGSVLTSRFSEPSDIDVLVEFQPDIEIGFFRLADIEAQLSRLFGAGTSTFELRAIEPLLP